MGIIELENMQFYAYHGCFKEEKVVGNYFRVDVKIKGDCTKAASSDNIADAINYQTVFNLVKREMDVTSNLLEHVSERILNAIYAAFPNLDKVRVKVCKMNPPLGGQTQQVSVSLER